jgi:2-polyprenyl-3-methyl-5-hydroxy-6-metoxy-1,4-benzoquinol methylase
VERIAAKGGVNVTATPAIEDVRRYWNERPCNIRHSCLPVGTQEYFDQVQWRKYFVEPHIPGFAQFERWKGKQVLELGCGIGTDSVNFARAGAQLTVVDLSEKSLQVCRQRFQVYGLEADFHCGDMEQLSSFVPERKYDLIYSFGVIHHTPHPDRVFQQLKKFCSPDTELRVMLYSKWSWKVFWILLKYGRCAFWKHAELVRKYSEAQTGCPVTHDYSFRDIRRLLPGFQTLSVRKEHIFPFVIEKYVRHEYEWEWYFRWMPRPLFRWLERRMGWHTLVVARPK